MNLIQCSLLLCGTLNVYSVSESIMYIECCDDYFIWCIPSSIGPFSDDINIALAIM